MNFYNPFKRGIKDKFINVKIVVDRFHYTKLVLQCQTKKDWIQGVILQKLATQCRMFYNFRVCSVVKTLIKWQEYISNSYKTNYSNGPTEGKKNFFWIQKFTKLQKYNSFIKIKQFKLKIYTKN